MNTPHPGARPDPRMDQMVIGLNDLRDALVRLSLLMRDYQFEFDSIERQQALQQTHQVIERAMSCEHRSHDKRA